MSYVISSDRETGTITYHCPTTQSAVDKLADFRRADYRNIVIMTGRRRISESRLVSLADFEHTHGLPSPAKIN